MAPAATIVQEGLQDFAKALERAHLEAPWLGPEMSHDPIPHMVPFVWRWADIEPLIMRTGELMTPGRGAERRIACWIQLLRPGVHTQAHRQTSSAVYHVFTGQGHSVIGGTRFDWRQGDFFAIPPWAWHEHVNAGQSEAVLFSIQDTPVFETLGLYRAEAYTEHGGHQPMTRMWHE